MTEEQKREFERIFNFYSLQKEYDSECRAEWSDKMWAFRTAVSILFYKFTFDKFEEKNGVEYSSYILEADGIKADCGKGIGNIEYMHYKAIKR